MWSHIIGKQLTQEMLILLQQQRHIPIVRYLDLGSFQLEGIQASIHWRIYSYSTLIQRLMVSLWMLLIPPSRVISRMIWRVTPNYLPLLNHNVKHTILWWKTLMQYMLRLVGCQMSQPIGSMVMSTYKGRLQRSIMLDTKLNHKWLTQLQEHWRATILKDNRMVALNSWTHMIIRYRALMETHR